MVGNTTPASTPQASISASRAAVSKLARGAVSRYLRVGVANTWGASCSAPPSPARPAGMSTSPSATSDSVPPGPGTMRIARSR